MAEVGGKIRLFVRCDLGPGAAVPLEADQAHYLFNVMRLGVEAPVTVFNGRDGEWFARVTRTGKNGGALAVHAAGAAQRRPPDLTLLFAPIKKARTDFIVEKATELGCARIQPVFTRHTNSERLRVDRLRAHAIEAGEERGGPWAILIGPEGGFAEEEVARLRSLPYVLSVTLGPRVLRADTAACAAITLWQSVLGDWR